MAGSGAVLETDARSALVVAAARAHELLSSAPTYLSELAAWSGHRYRTDGVPSRNTAPDATAIGNRRFAAPGLAPGTRPDNAALTVLTTDADDNMAHLRAGEAASTVLLAATRLGQATCVFTEFCELGSTRTAVRESILGKRGAGGVLDGHEEREQTLNQLLSEMDGFDESRGIVLLAATNRPETLDPALLRPGRFDRQVTVPLPNQSERAAILAVHIGGKHLGPDVELGVVARGTPGFSGADLANLVNEAAINAVREGRTVHTAADPVGRAGPGPARPARHLERPAARRTPLGGRARVRARTLSRRCAHADPVAKVTILSAGMALGATEQLPEAERHLYSEDYLAHLLAVRLGGRAAELVVLGQASTGAANDLSGATVVAAKMVTEFGLSPALVPIGYGRGGAAMGSDGRAELLGRPYSEETQRVVDQEIARLVREAEAQAVALLKAHRGALERLAARLQDEETVDGSAVLAALNAEPRTPPGTAGSPASQGLPAAAPTTAVS